MNSNNKYLGLTTIFLIAFIISLIIIPSYTLAQDPERDYGAATTSTLQRMLDAWDKGPFCASIGRDVGRPPVGGRASGQRY